MGFYKHFFRCVLILNAIQAFAQDRLSDSLLRIRNSCYEEPPSLFLFTAGYRCPVSKSSIINSGQGIYTESGINPGTYILKDLVLGIYAGIGFQDRFWKTSFNPHFSRDYNASVKEEQNYATLDSAVIQSSRYLIRNTKGNAAVIWQTGPHQVIAPLYILSAIPLRAFLKISFYGFIDTCRYRRLPG